MEAELARLQEELAAGSSALSAQRLGHDPEVAKKMRALGYLGPTSSRSKERTPGSSDLPDPKKEIARLNARQEAGGHLSVATSLMLKGDLEGALREVTEAEALAPRYAEVKATKGLVLVRSGDLEAGIELLETAAEEDPESSMIHQTLNNLGIAYLQTRQCDKAIDALERSLSHRGDYSNALYNLGLAYETCGMESEAIEAYTAFLDSKPNLDRSTLSSLEERVDSLRMRVEGAGGGGGE
jgi:tetratricopeptide (TPR) repeat protein